MERKNIDYKVTYFKDGKEQTTIFTIKRIPQSVLIDYAEIAKVVTEVIKMGQRMQTIIEETGYIVYNKEENAREKVEKLLEEKKELEKKMMAIDAGDFYEKRYQLIRKVLEKNGYTEEYLLSRDFWFDDVDTKEMMNFLESVVYKDIIDGKKKAL